MIKVQAEKCKADGKPALEVQSYTDQPTSILAVRSKRADAFFSSQAPLTYFVQQSNGQLELAGVGQPNGFDDLYPGRRRAQGLAARADVLLDAVKKLMSNGTYAAIMKKWGLENNMIKDARHQSRWDPTEMSQLHDRAHRRVRRCGLPRRAQRRMPPFRNGAAGSSG